MSTIFLTYTNTSIAQCFFATAAAFAGLSLYGYTTKRDLSAFGTFLIMGVFGILIASLLNIWFQSTALGLAISILGVLLFAGLTAYDTQKLKSMYSSVAGTEVHGKAVIMGALNLYLDFINSSCSCSACSAASATEHRDSRLKQEAGGGDSAGPFLVRDLALSAIWRSGGGLHLRDQGAVQLLLR